MKLSLLRESKRKFTELEGKLREDLLMAKIRDTENSQCVAELTQKISNLEFKVNSSKFDFKTLLKSVRATNKHFDCC